VYWKHGNMYKQNAKQRLGQNMARTSCTHHTRVCLLVQQPPHQKARAMLQEAKHTLSYRRPRTGHKAVASSPV
jgi:hypothetical protein